ncbi:MAG: DUF2339 domain-containing protein [Opitutaceae bacterium]
MVPLLILLLALVLIGVPIWAVLKILSLGARNEQLEQRLRTLEQEFRQRHEPHRPEATPFSGATASAPVALSPAPHVTPLNHPEPPPAIPAHRPAPTPYISPPPVIPRRAAESSGSYPQPPPALPRPARTPARARFNWEQFTGAKLLAWTGGAAAFLGAAFFIKYSFEHDLIPPAMRVAIGYVFAFALVLVGLRIPRGRYAVTAQTLCATGVVCLYAVTFACSSIYEFPFFTPLRTFGLMALITAAAFILAVRLGAQVVAVLGMLGGFLTPVLLSTGRDNTFGLFGYIALLDVGLVALALYQRWFFLVPLAAAGTVAMQLGWAMKFLNATKAPTAMVVALVFCGVFLIARVIARKVLAAASLRTDHNAGAGGTPAVRGPASAHFCWPAIAMPCVALLFALWFISYRTIAAQPGLLFSFIFAADACLLALAWLDEEPPHLHLVGGFAVFGLLAVWTGARLTGDLLPWALGLYLVHGAVHTSFPLLLERHRPGLAATWWSQLFPPLALVLMLGPFFRLDAVPFVLWPCVLLVDLLAIGLAVFTGSIIAVATALVLTLVATALWMFRLPPALANDAPLLLVIGGFAGLFFGAGMLLAHRLRDPDTPMRGSLADRRAQLPAFPALMPFLLLVMMTQRLPRPNPSGVFGLALLLVLLCFGLTRALIVPWLPACALAGVAALEYAWDARHATRSFAAAPFAWPLVFYAAFAIFPFVFRSRFAALTGPWAVAALSGMVHFPLIYRIVERTTPNDVMGLVPALFTVAPLVSMLAVSRVNTAGERARLDQLAWFGGVALFFVTLIVPVQFERQWITLGWALEGAALLWLFRRVPHPGLRATGVVLLVASFVRLALNPAVLGYHARPGMPILNWHLYTYGIVIACLFTSGALLPAGADRVCGVRVRPLLFSLGVVLAFLLLNIQIADFFSAPGTRVLTFQFSGHFGRDMTYTIAWALFALCLLLISIWKRTRAGRYAALGLLGVAVLKLFLHDLERLGALHRIGALFAVAIIAIVASLAYQRFLPGDDTTGSKR